MNKYLEALMKLKNYAWSDKRLKIGKDDLEIYRCYDLLRELAEKAPSMKKEVRQSFIDGEVYICPTCHSPVDEIDRYCANCGQRIDGLE